MAVFFYTLLAFTLYNSLFVCTLFNTVSSATPQNFPVGGTGCPDFLVLPSKLVGLVSRISCLTFQISCSCVLVFGLAFQTLVVVRAFRASWSWHPDFLVLPSRSFCLLVFRANKWSYVLHFLILCPAVVYLIRTLISAPRL